MRWLKSRSWYYFRRYYAKIKSNRGIFVMAEDWDNLIILDACRYDTFKEVTGIDVDYRISRGSGTEEFLIENFANRKFNDTIYVTANPQVDVFVRDSFYKVISVWKYSWDNELNTVLPQTVVDYALEAKERFPDKRLIIHFIQPHYPFIKDPEIKFEDWKKGRISLDEIYKAYKRNLEAVIPYAFQLAKALDGKSVITSDHGEAFGEWALPFPVKVVTHLNYIHIPVLVKVPWLVFESEERREIRFGNEKQRLKDRIRKLKEKGKL